MKQRYFAIGTQDSREPWLALYQRRGRRTSGLIERYRAFACGRCGKLDTLRLLRNQPLYGVRKPDDGTEANKSNDFLLVVSSKSRRAIETVSADGVEFFTLPDEPAAHVMYPKRIFRPPADARLYTPVEPAIQGEAFQLRGRRCPKCGRYRSTTFRSEWFDPPVGTVIGGASVELGVFGTEAFSWIASEAVVEALCGHRGWTFRDLDQERRHMLDWSNRNPL